MRRLRGRVVHGRRLGRKLGFPTANINPPAGARPPRGVWRVLVSGTTLTPRPAVCNVGVRPTIGGARLLVEVHIPGFRGNLYGRTLTVEFVSPIRTEKKFSSVADLRRQIARDVASLTQARPPATMNA